MRNILLLLVLTFYLLSCGSSGQGDPSFDYQKQQQVCTVEGKKHFVYSILKDSYYWADSVPEINISDYEDANQLLHSLAKKPEDRFSFILPKKYYNDLFVKGSTKSYGIQKSDSYDENSTVIYALYKDAPLYNAGVRRGDIVLNPTNMNGEFRIKKPSGKIFDINVTPQEFEITNVSNHKVIDLNGTKIGYFTFASFVGPNLKEELDSEFAKLKRENIDELVVDLRYNGGGLVDVANYLGALIGGDNVGGKVFLKQLYNKKYSRFNTSVYFPSNLPNALNLNRVFFIITDDTASASEALIDGLRPYMDVVTIGSKSYGKQYGMHLAIYCDIVVAAIDIKNANALEDSNYSNGIEPTCKAKDDLGHLFGNRNENSLKEAIHFIQNGECD